MSTQSKHTKIPLLSACFFFIPFTHWPFIVIARFLRFCVTHFNCIISKQASKQRTEKFQPFFHNKNNKISRIKHKNTSRRRIKKWWWISKNISSAIWWNFTKNLPLWSQSKHRVQFVDVVVSRLDVVVGQTFAFACCLLNLVVVRGNLSIWDYCCCCCLRAIAMKKC